MLQRSEFDSRRRGLRDPRSLRVLRVGVIPCADLEGGEFAESRDQYGLFLGDRLLRRGDIVHFIPWNFEWYETTETQRMIL